MTVSMLMRPDPRVRVAHEGDPRAEGRCVLYWMQRAQRGLDNPALNYAIAWGNTLGLPVLACFGLTADYPGAQRRHYRFLIEGLADARNDLAACGVPLVVRLGRPDRVAIEVANLIQPALVIGDDNPVRVAQEWRSALVRDLAVPCRLVDADVVVPSSLFPKEEFAARTLRPKMHRAWNDYLKPLPRPIAKNACPDALIPRGETLDVEGLLAKLKVGGASELSGYRGGTREALRRLDLFVEHRLARYAEERNEPSPYATSELSAHLHFGQISPLTIALRVRDSAAGDANIEALLEELIVRRELAVNFVARNPKYDSIEGCPRWALETLQKHEHDPRPYLYDPATLEAGSTHDPLWNAAQQEMVHTGRMHNYLRMYWAKKILEWSPDAATAFKVALDLNDRYEMDGRDPNGYTGVAWAVGGKHDRPWPERPIFGTVRFMSYASTRRKFRSDQYIERVRAIVEGCGDNAPWALK